jgi:predicted signal transduction protein with EAL and GGDEF domain
MEAATRIRQVIREVDTLARIGGDEFVVLCEEVHSVHDVTDLAERILGVLEDEFDLDGVEAFVSTSIGIALWSGVESPDDLLRNADTAMYRAKESGRARFELFDDAMQAWAAARLDFETSLRHAVGRGELRLHFQPIVELETGEIVDCEALVRWERPNVGLVGPVEFISVAEETGLIVPIGAWVLEEACREAARWQREWPARRIGVSVNLSSRQIARSDIVTTVREALAHSGLEPQRLSLEITESLLVEDTPGALDLLHELKALGVRLALDDFGTGYSSLTYLRRFPIDVIKIDQSFVRTIGTAEEDTTIVAAIIDLARALHIDVIAEGVSDLAHVAALLNLGARYAQGYHFARPVPPEILPTVLLRGRALHAG